MKWYIKISFYKLNRSHNGELKERNNRKTIERRYAVGNNKRLILTGQINNNHSFEPKRACSSIRGPVDSERRGNGEIGGVSEPVRDPICRPTNQEQQGNSRFGSPRGSYGFTVRQRPTQGAFIYPCITIRTI